MGAVAYVTAGTAQTLATSASVPLPASLAAGNLLILHAASADGTITSATPSGWTQLTGSPFSGGGITQARIYYKISTGSETGTISITANGTKGHARIDQYAPTATETLTILTQQAVTDTNSNTALSVASGTLAAAPNDSVLAFGFAAGDFTAGLYNSFNITTTGFTVPGSTNVRGNGRQGTTSYQWGLQDKAITTGTSGTLTNIMQGNCTGVTGITVYVILRSQAATLTPGFTCQVKQSGTFVAAKLRVRSAGTWITPSSITEYHPASGTVESRTNLPWNLNVTYTGKWAMTHYVPWYPPSLDDVTPKSIGGGLGDYWDKYYTKPGGAEPGGTNSLVFGGFTRDRPLPRAHRGTGYEALDIYDEVKRIAEAKFDGVFVDFVSSTTTSRNWLNIGRFFDASDQYFADTGKRVYVMPMPDGTGGATRQVLQAGSTTLVDVVASANALADNYGAWLSEAALWKYDTSDTLTIPVFAPDAWGGKANPSSDRATFWSQFKSRMSATYGTTVNLWFCWVSDWNSTTTGAGSAIGAQAWGLSRWGDRDDLATKAANVNNVNAPSYSHTKYGKPWMHYIAPGDHRPNDTNQAAGYRWWESRGTRTLENTWNAAIAAGTDCEMVQQVTWNDFAEHAHLCPSVNQGYALVDVNTYWLHRYKTGAYPVVVRDGLYLLHRIHPFGLASFTGSQTRFGLPWGSTTAVNEVEVLAFATSAGTVELLVNGAVTQTSAVTTGMNRLNWTLPTTGIISARMTRTGSTVPGTVVTSTVTMGATQAADDFHYRAFSSLRQFTGT